MLGIPSSVRVAALAGDAARVVALEIVAKTGSTNADLLARAPTLDRPTLRWAQQQTAGRGRMGRTWLTTGSDALTFSLAWRLALPLSALSGLPLAVGVALARQIIRQGVAVQLKWPNDLLQNGAKLGGILIESCADLHVRGARWVVIGVGLNLGGAQALSAQLGRAVADVAHVQIDREAWMAALLAGLCDMLPVFERDGFTPFAAQWNRLDAWAGQQVIIADGDIVLHRGRAVGVDAAGCLLLDTAAGTIKVTSGDVSLKKEEQDDAFIG